MNWKRSGIFVGIFVLVCAVAYALDGIAFEEKSSDPMTGSQVGLWAGDTTGANEAWWRRDDGSSIDLSTGGAAVGAEALASDIGPVGNVGSGVDVLKTYTLPGGTAGDDGDSLRITVWGKISGGNDEGNISIEFGAFQLDGFTLQQASAAEWKSTTLISREDASNAEGAANNTLGAAVDVTILTFAIDFTSNIVIRVTGENTTDTDNDRAVCRGFVVELVRAP